MRKHKFKIVILIIIVAIFAFYRAFFTMDGIKIDEKALIKTVDSPNGKYKLEFFLKDDDPLSHAAVVGRIAGSKKIIFFAYPCYDVNVSFTDDDNVVINWVEARENYSIKVNLNLKKGETYDWRNEN